MTAAAPSPQVSASRYLEIGQHALFAVLLSLGAARALHLDAAGVDRHHGVAALVGAAMEGLWYVAGAVLGRVGQQRARASSVASHDNSAAVSRAGARTSRIGRAWFGVLVAGWLILLALSPDFSWVAFALFLLAIHLLPTGSALAVVTALTAIVIGVQITSGTGNLTGQIAGPIIGALVAVGAGLIYRRILAESEHRRRLVGELIAAQDDLVVLHDELAETQREAGVLTERQRLARDIHDTLAQGLSSIVLLSRAGLAGDERTHCDILRQIEQTAADNLDEARRVVHALTPASLESAPLPAAIGRLLRRLEEQTGIATSLHVDGDVTTAGTAGEVALLRIAQSALSNVRLHSGAGRVAVSLTADHTPGSAHIATLTLDVVDDGHGFEPGRLDGAPLGGTGFGLRAMRDRLTALGGSLVVDSAPGEGTTLSAQVPLLTTRRYTTTEPSHTPTFPTSEESA